MTGPDFIIIGAMKCGTSTLAAQLGAQPGLFMTTPKEPNYFSDDTVFAQGADWYGALFDAARPGDLTGEASTHYTKLPTHPDTIARLDAAGLAPRLIYVIRNPIDRLISHYIHEWTMRVIAEPLGSALSARPELRAYSCYGAQIEPWVARFGAGNILVVTMEEMRRDPQRLLERVGAFLGREGLVWQPDFARMNVSAERTRLLPMHRLLVANPVAAWLRRTFVPKSLRARIKAGRRISERPELSAAERAMLEAEFAADRARLEAMLPELQLAECYPWMR